MRGRRGSPRDSNRQDSPAPRKHIDNQLLCSSECQARLGKRIERSNRWSRLDPNQGGWGEERTMSKRPAVVARWERAIYHRVPDFVDHWSRGIFLFLSLVWIVAGAGLTWLSWAGLAILIPGVLFLIRGPGRHPSATPRGCCAISRSSATCAIRLSRSVPSCASTSSRRTTRPTPSTVRTARSSTSGPRTRSTRCPSARVTTSTAWATSGSSTRSTPSRSPPSGSG